MGLITELVMTGVVAADFYERCPSFSRKFINNEYAHDANKRRNNIRIKFDPSIFSEDVKSEVLNVMLVAKEFRSIVSEIFSLFRYLFERKTSTDLSLNSANILKHLRKIREKFDSPNDELILELAAPFKKASTTHILSTLENLKGFSQIIQIFHKIHCSCALNMSYK